MTASDVMKAALLDALGEALDNGLIELRTAGNGLVSTTVLGADAFAAASGTNPVQIAANGSLSDPEADGDAANDVTQCQVRLADETLWMTLTAGLATDEPVPEVVLSSRRIQPGDVVSWAFVKFEM